VFSLPVFDEMMVDVSRKVAEGDDVRQSKVRQIPLRSVGESRMRDAQTFVDGTQ
jgi:hypothetical protein